MFTGICFIAIGVALLLGGMAYIGSVDSGAHEILGAVICFVAWALAVWGIVRYRTAAIGKKFGALQASHDAARARHKLRPAEPEQRTEPPAADSAPSHRLPGP